MAYPLNPIADLPGVFDALDTPPQQPVIPIDRRITDAITEINLNTTGRSYVYDLREKHRERLGRGKDIDNYFGLYLSKITYNYETLIETFLYKPFWKNYYDEVYPPLVHDMATSTDTHNTPAMHFVFLRIISGCDSAHDFTPDVFRAAYADLQATEKTGPGPLKDFFKLEWSKHSENFHLALREAISKGIIRACVQTFGKENGYKMLTWCITVIAWLLPDHIGTQLFGKFTIKPTENQETVCMRCLSKFLLSDTVAKSVVSLITKIIGIQVTPVSQLLKSLPTDMTEIYKTMDPRVDLKTPVKITIDATTSGWNNAELLQAIISPSPDSLFSRWFSTAKFFGFVEDSLVNDFDPACRGIVAKTAETVGSYVKFTGTISFDVSFDLPYDDTQPTILNAKISQTGDKVECVCTTFYGEKINKTYNAKDVCVYTCAKHIIREYSRYDNWTTEKMYTNVYKIALGKHLGDFMISLKHIGDDGEKLAVSVDRIMANFTALGSKTMIMEGGTGTDVFKRIYIFEGCRDKGRRLQSEAPKKLKPGGSSTDPASSFGSSTTRIKYASKLELKNKLKSVGIKITKTIRGKRKYLSRKELENKAKLFNKMQNTARRMKIKIMYKKNRIYKYKTYKRLQKEIKKMKNKPRNKKMYNSIVKRSSFG